MKLLNTVLASLLIAATSTASHVHAHEHKAKAHAAHKEMKQHGKMQHGDEGVTQKVGDLIIKKVMTLLLRLIKKKSNIFTHSLWTLNYCYQI